MSDVKDRITELKEKKGAVILAHNYQLPEIQDIADFIGDSLELSVKSEKIEKDLIVFCGVDFMAEQAKVLNPGKKVLIPTKAALCPMAALLPRWLLERYREQYPGVPVVLYVNTHADAKALADYIVTSANAADVVSRIDSDRILFGPDANLADYVAEKTGKEVIPIPPSGHCAVHQTIAPIEVQELIEAHPDAEVMAHPECTRETRKLAHYVGSTSQMLRHAKESSSKKFIVVTEKGLVYRMQKEMPDKTFIPVETAICTNMKKINLDNLLKSLQEEIYEVEIGPDIAERVRQTLIKTRKLLEK